MLGYFAECLIRASLVVAGVYAALAVLRVRSPRVRHVAWTATVITMLSIPFLIGGRIEARLSVPVPTLTGQAMLPSPSAPPVFQSLAAAEARPAERGSSLHKFDVVVAVYCLVALVMIGRLLVGTRKARKLLRSARLEDGNLVHERSTGPSTIGWLRPRILVPPAFRNWPPERREAALIHEREHVKWRDPLAQWLALLNRSLFWIHPAAWWLERHLADLAEDACDRAVLDHGCPATVYAGLLLDCADALEQRAFRFGMGIEGRGLGRRIPRILAPARQLSGWRSQLRATVALLLCAGISFASAALSLRPVPVPVFGSLQARPNPLRVTILTPIETSLTAVPAPAERPDAREHNHLPPMPLRPAGSRGLTVIYFDLAGMDRERRNGAVDSARRWVREQARSASNRAFALVVRESGHTSVAQDSTPDLGLIGRALAGLEASASGDEPDSVEAHFAAIESVVENLLAIQGDRKLVCFLGPAIGNGLSEPRQPRPVRFVPTSTSPQAR